MLPTHRIEKHLSRSQLDLQERKHIPPRQRVWCIHVLNGSSQLVMLRVDAVKLSLVTG